MTSIQFAPGLVLISPKGKEFEPEDQEETDEMLAKEGWKVSPTSAVQPTIQTPSATPQQRVVAPPLKANQTKEQRRALREKNQANSMVIPEKFRIKGGVAKEGKIVAFPEKFSARTGSVYSACQLECDGVKFCTLDPGEDFDVNMVVTLNFFESQNTAIGSGFEVNISL